MKDKVCDYKYAKELDELGFDCDSHTGYWLHWIRETDYYIWFSSTGKVDIFLKENNYPKNNLIEAYGSDDLLNWLEKNTGDIWYLIQQESNYVVRKSWQDYAFSQDPKPSNALAKAIITILKGKNNE